MGTLSVFKLKDLRDEYSSEMLRLVCNDQFKKCRRRHASLGGMASAFQRNLASLNVTKSYPNTWLLRLFSFSLHQLDEIFL